MMIQFSFLRTENDTLNKKTKDMLTYYIIFKIIDFEES